jgi:hypothetical protein
MKKIVFLLVVLSTIYLLPHVAAAPNATIQNDSSFIDEAGYYHVVGEVKNTGDVWLHFVRIAATFKGQNGDVVDTNFAYTELDRVAPNVASGFDIVELDTGKSAMITSYTLALDFQQTDALTTALQIVNTSSSKISLGWLQIVGEVKNNGDTISDYTKVVATFYGGDGRVVAVAFTFTDPITVQPHSQQSFKLTLLSTTRSNIATTWSLDTQSNQYASVPEFPWPLVALIAALSLGVVAVRRKSRILPA